MMNTIARLITKPLAATMAGALALAAPAALFAAEAPATRDVQANDLDRAVAALRAITTMQADFTQTDRAGNTVSGTLTLRNPGRIRFEYGNDANLLIVSDGRALTLVDYDVNQVERWPIRNSPLGALLDPQNNMRGYGRLVQTGSDNVVSIEVRDPDRPEFGVITMIFVENAGAPGGLELASWVALDAQNSRTTVRLRNHRYGISVSDSTFRYRDPRRSTRRPG